MSLPDVCGKGNGRMRWMTDIKRRGLLWLFAVAVNACALDADTACRLLRESAENQRELQSEIRRFRCRAMTVPSVVTNRADSAENAEGVQQPFGNADAAPERLTQADVIRLMNAPEMKERFGKVVEAFNARLPELNAKMANALVSGETSEPLRPLTTEQLRQVIGEAVRGDGESSVPQFEALKRWQAAQLDRMTNGNAKIRN